jgi:regulator of nucleoside diphosphate kinase
MFRRKQKTITRPNWERLLAVTQAEANTHRWALSVDALCRAMDGARVVEPAEAHPALVTMHSTVRVRDLDRRNVAELLTLVYPEEADPRAGKLSVLAPLGTALLGTYAGNVVRVAGGPGVRSIRVEEVVGRPRLGAPEDGPCRPCAGVALAAGPA